MKQHAVEDHIPRVGRGVGRELGSRRVLGRGVFFLSHVPNAVAESKDPPALDRHAT